MRKWLGLSLVLLLCCATGAQAQIPVTDAGNLFQNTIAAVQSVLTTIQTVLIEANQILELTPLDDIAVAGGIAEDMQGLVILIQQAEGLSYDFSALNHQITVLFALDTAPETRDGLTERLADIKRLKYASYRHAAQIQTLIGTAIHTTEHLLSLLDTLGGLVGNMQGNQTHAQFTATVAKHSANLDVQMAAYHRAQTVDKLSEALIIESITKIQARRMENWPTP